MERLVVERFPIQSQDLAILAHPLVKALAGFVAQPFSLDHLFFEIQRKEAIAPPVVGNKIIKICSDESPYIDAHEIEQTEARGIRHADQRAGERVHFFDREILFQHGLPDGAAQEAADPIGDEIGSVFSANHAFAETAIGELLYIRQDLRIRLGPWNQLHQVQVTRRIEKVSAQEVAAKLGRETLGDLGERNAAGVGGKDCAGFAHSVHLAPQRALGVQVFNDGLDHPVATGELLEIVIEITRFHQRGLLIGKESAGALFQSFLDALQRGRVAIRLAGYIQQQRGNARIREMRRDP